MSANLVAYCDGSHRQVKHHGNFGCSVAILLDLDTGEKKYFTKSGKFSNNMQAEHYALGLAIDNAPANSNITIFSDCLGLVNKFNGDSKNKLSQSFAKGIKTKFNNIFFEWIKGHTGKHLLHEEADVMAGKIVREYWKNKLEKSA